jgi:hypothetical protein
VERSSRFKFVKKHLCGDAARRLSSGMIDAAIIGFNAVLSITLLDTMAEALGLAGKSLTTYQNRWYLVAC